jgi:ribosomal protein S18 acetylase RimI-like enzyme
MAGDIAVRVAGPADAAAIARVHIESWRVGYRGLLADDLLAHLSVSEREFMWRERLDGGDAQQHRRRVNVAVAGESVVGFMAAGPSREQHTSVQSGEIYALYVHPDRWSMGVGQALMRCAIDYLAAIGAGEALLWVLTSNARARRFYELAGWAWDGRAKTKRLSGLPDFDSEVEEVCYRRRLPSSRASDYV